jgi:uncharacterized membrane protein YcfT
MNVVIVIVVICITLGVIRFLVSRRCLHKWENVDDYLDRSGKYRTFVQRCSKCGNLRVKKLKVR